MIVLGAGRYYGLDAVIERTGPVVPGLAVLLLWGVYRMASPGVEQTTERREITAD